MEFDIARQNGKEFKSKQPHFSETTDSGSFTAILRWQKLAYMDQPDYIPDSRKRDTWLQKFWRMEPLLAGVHNSAVALDKNRRWALVGGRNQVRRFLNILLNAEGGKGWRTFASLQSQAFYSSDIQAIAEIERDGENGPMVNLYSVDPTRCRLTGDPATPLAYKPLKGKIQKWRPEDYMRTSTLESVDEGFHLLGYCAVSRCVFLAQILIAVYEYDQEKLGARSPKGLLLLKNINQLQWDTAMKVRTVLLSEKEQMYYGGVSVLAHDGPESPDAKLVALSNLPDNFNRELTTNFTMYGYALAYGYNPEEFWPVQFGALGRTTEAEMSQKRATEKGGTDFSLAFQENIQAELPNTIQFTFDRRDDEGEKLKAEADKAKAEVVTTMYEAGLMQGRPLVSWEEGRFLLAERNLIPRDWTTLDEESLGTDTGLIRSRQKDELFRLRQLHGDDPHVQRAAHEYPDEPIIRVQYNPRTGQISETILWQTGRTLIEPKFASLPNHPLIRQEDDSEVLFISEDSDVEITEEDVNEAIDNAYSSEFKELLNAEEITQEEISEN